MPQYAENPAWADIVPLPTDEGGPNPLAAIAYSDDYSETMAYLRAVMAAHEHSPRVLELTEDLIDMNPAHYTVWLYRAETLLAIGADLREELEWLNEVALTHQKNYQIWHHRNLIVDKLCAEHGAQEDEGLWKAECAFVEAMFDRDAKNYHVWSYRQWLVRRFGLWDKDELEFTERMLQRDIRNNSAWNHRWFVVNGREEKANAGDGKPGVSDPDIRAREIKFAQDAIAKTPQNQSPWNYLRGVARKTGMSLVHLKGFAEQYASLKEPDVVRSSFALDLLADIYKEEKKTEEAREVLDLLARRYDPIRKNYWEYRKGLLGVTAA
ncbi:protein prenylyltransferase [Hortaea werneckii]|uniref:Protein farnesyltransferase/geranylgeranyltransferase type-1 subunit alpha n=1 Tax=Hortaea werneckii TaxID=91943 RepID=A0A3M7F482_HORWE|nr:protein prenylyltransferase [Hortaea werneckii]KAI6864075.1 protein prenylyltransferase [Hortaea werneckii]KAI7345277.1 protein prenylyltransferase [Hortaea werneckii]KAI7605134.1 protein prenylyltransferase [Hortaea werneckii]RMY83630.1 hypothetical protein D0864_07778 [Hortaea werneckii]